MEIITASMAASGNKKGKKKMRLWHKDLISVLPDKQLLGQWRECCCIARNIAVNGSPNHLLVNKIMEYPISHLWKYGYLIMCEMEERGYDCDFDKFEKWFDNGNKVISLTSYRGSWNKTDFWFHTNGAKRKNGENTLV